MNDDGLLTARQVADRLGLSPATIGEWVRAGKLRGIRLGGTPRGRLRFRPADVDAFLDQWATSAPAPQEPPRRLEAV